jgi:[protein-PII] uridylyltransferase
MKPSLSTLRQLYLQQAQQLTEAYRASAKARHYLRAHSKLVDSVLIQLWHLYPLPAATLLIAVGGYGRQELYPASDIDLLLLLPDMQLTLCHQEAIAQYIRALWDMGLEVGHSVRTLDECLNEAAQDITVQTSLLDSRLISGSRTRFQFYYHTVYAHIKAEHFFEAKMLEQQQRHNRFQNVTYNLEPNIKESPGGLRDLHLIGWIAAVCRLGKSWQALSRHHILTQEEVRKLKRAERVLQSYRIHLHGLAKRREDKILFDYQHAMARMFQLKNNAAYQASEVLMARYYRAARIISQLTPLILQTLKPYFYAKTVLPSVPINDRFTLHQGRLGLVALDTFKQNPATILELFLLMQRQDDINSVDPQTLRALWHARGLIDQAFRANPEHQALFMAILREPRGLTRVLRMMNKYGVLGRYIPAFGAIVGRMQHDLFHVYTVDEHTLLLLRNLRRFRVPAYTHEYPLCSRLLEEFARPEVLYLAALFHDIAKGRGGDHSELGAKDAQLFCETHGLIKEDTELVCWLVRYHLHLSFVAQKQDIYNPTIVQSFASFVQDARHLNALYLLTVADIRATSPKVWSAWKAKLLEDLYHATLAQLHTQQPSTASFIHIRQIEALQLIRAQGLAKDAHEAFWKKLDPVYFLRHAAHEIAWHTWVLHQRFLDKMPIIRAQASSIGEGLQILIYMPDQVDLFARICRFFEYSQYNIVDAKIHTTHDQYALDSFYVVMPNSITPYRDQMSVIEHTLDKVLNDATPLAFPLTGRLSRQVKHFPFYPHVLLRADESGQYYTLSITAADRTGLLSHIAQILTQHKITVHTAKIMTCGARVEDIFLVSGESLADSKQQLQLEQDLLQSLRV